MFVQDMFTLIEEGILGFYSTTLNIELVKSDEPQSSLTLVSKRV